MVERCVNSILNVAILSSEKFLGKQNLGKPVVLSYAEFG